jgi:hypothetical protein
MLHCGPATPRNEPVAGCAGQIPDASSRAAYAAGMAVTRDRRARPLADGNAAWLGSSTTSPTSSGQRSELLGVGARTAERRISRCSDCILAISRGGRYTLDNVVPAAAPATPASGTTKSPAGSGERGSTSGHSCCVTSKSGWHSGCTYLRSWTRSMPRRRRHETSLLIAHESPACRCACIKPDLCQLVRSASSAQLGERSHHLLREGVGHGDGLQAGLDGDRCGSGGGS